MGWGPTADMVSGDLVACYELSCDIYKNGEWNHLVDTRESRRFHSSVVKDNRVLLIGGRDATTTTEWISMDGSPSQEGPFTNRHGPGHCTIRVSNEKIVMVAGTDGTSEYFVTEYDLTSGMATPLTNLIQYRRMPACGVYKGTGDEQVRRVFNLY